VHLGLAHEGCYINYLDLQYPSPSALNISAIGEAFSEFSLPVDKPDLITGLSIENAQPIAAGSTFTWVAFQASDTMLVVRLEKSTDRVASFVVDA